MKRYLSILVVLLLAFSFCGCMTIARLHQDKGILGLKGETTAGAIVMFNAPTLGDKQAWEDWRKYWAPYDEFKAKGTHDRDAWKKEWTDWFKKVKAWWKDLKSRESWGGS